MLGLVTSDFGQSCVLNLPAPGLSVDGYLSPVIMSGHAEGAKNLGYICHSEGDNSSQTSVPVVDIENWEEPPLFCISMNCDDYSELDESKIGDLPTINGIQVDDMYLHMSSYQDPSSYSYTETDGSGGRPRPLAVERLVSANGTNSVTSTDSRDLLFDTNHNDRVPSPYRKRENPLYDSADRVRQSSLEEKTKPSLCSCPFVLIIFFSIVAVLAFLLAALAMGGITGDNSPRTAALVTPSSQLKEALDRLQTLEVQYMALQNKVKSLEDTDVNILSSNISSQSKKILQLEETLAVYKTTLQNQYLSLQANFSHRIDMVSKMPGPPGAGNLTLCQYKKLSVGEPSSKDTSETKFVPDTEQAANDWVITGLECSVNGGTQASLVSAREWNTDKFKCICSGKTGGLNRFCELHYWRCPRIS